MPCIMGVHPFLQAGLFSTILKFRRLVEVRIRAQLRSPALIGDSIHWKRQ